jgi:hypothetical protein
MTVRAEDWEILDLEPDADLSAVRRAHRRRRALYESASLATYNLLDEEERGQMLARIDEAYERIVGAEPAAAPPGVKTIEVVEPGPAIPTGPPPDPGDQPGAFLRYHRLRAGLTLHRIAIETKIGVAILEHIEQEDFAALPAAVFVRGHVVQFARELHLEAAEDLAKHYLAKMHPSEDVPR